MQQNVKIPGSGYHKISEFVVFDAGKNRFQRLKNT